MLPGGTAYITDVGMTGPRGGVIGVRKEQSIRGFVTHMTERFETSDDDPWLMGVVVALLASRCGRRDRAGAAAGACGGPMPIEYATPSLRIEPSRCCASWLTVDTTVRRLSRI